MLDNILTTETNRAMSTLLIHDGTVTIHLTTGEKVAGVHGDLEFPLSAVTAVEVVPDALAAVHGLRAPGMSLPGVRKVGTWRTKEGAEFVVASAGQSGVRLHLQGEKLSSVLVGDTDAAELARSIEAAR
jgi:hypothetical protein